MNPILFQSDSRLLGTSPASDFGMYGAQPAYTAQFSPAGTDRGADPSDEAAEGHAAPLAEVPDGTGAAAAAPAAHDAPAAHSVALTPLPAAAAPSSAEAASLPPLAGPSALTPISLPAANETDAPIVPEPPGSDGAPALPAASSAGPPPSAGPGDLAEAAFFSAPVLTATSSVVPALVANVADLVPALPPVGSLADGLADTVTEAIDALPLDALTATPAAAIGAVSDIADDLPVQDLLGADPAGGIATLVNLVTVADVLDLKEAGAPADGSLAGIGTPLDHLLDTLTAEPIAPPETFDDDDGGVLGGDHGVGDIVDTGLPDLPSLPPVTPPDLGLGI